jgi:hypothetical protein
MFLSNKVWGDTPPDAGERFIWDRTTNTHRPAGELPGTSFFVKGPLPCAWLERAGKLPGKSLHVALGLWWIRGMVGKPSFPFKRKAATAFGASKDAAYDALARLEGAGLITVQRARGKSPVVTMLDV